MTSTPFGSGDLEVEHHHVGPGGGEARQRLVPVGGDRDHLEPGGRQVPLHRVAPHRVVVDHHHPGRSAGRHLLLAAGHAREPTAGRLLALPQSRGCPPPGPMVSWGPWLGTRAVICPGEVSDASSTVDGPGRVVGPAAAPAGRRPPGQAVAPPRRPPVKAPASVTRHPGRARGHGRRLGRRPVGRDRGRGRRHPGSLRPVPRRPRGDVHRPAASDVASSLDVATGASTDVVLHLPAEVGGDPVVHSYDAPTGAIGPDKARVVLAHTATVAPADVRVNGETVFTNIANGEFAEAEVPGRHPRGGAAAHRAAPPTRSWARSTWRSRRAPCR